MLKVFAALAFTAVATASSVLWAGIHVLNAPISHASIHLSSLRHVAARAPVASIRIKTHVLLLSQDFLDQVPIKYNLKIPTHHVRPDTPETMNDATILDEATANDLLAIADYFPENLDFAPPAQDYPEDQDEFDCLSAMFRDPAKPMAPEFASSVVNGLSMQYKLHASADHGSAVFSPVTMMRADFPAAEIPNTAAHEAPFEHKVGVSVPLGSTLLIDAGPVKANRTEAKPSRHLLVLLRGFVVESSKK